MRLVFVINTRSSDHMVVVAYSSGGQPAMAPSTLTNSYRLSQHIKIYLSVYKKASASGGFRLRTIPHTPYRVFPWNSPVPSLPELCKS